jgi:hypothetical protein
MVGNVSTVARLHQIHPRSLDLNMEVYTNVIHISYRERYHYSYSFTDAIKNQEIRVFLVSLTLIDSTDTTKYLLNRQNSTKRLPLQID